MAVYSLKTVTLCSYGEILDIVKARCLDVTYSDVWMFEREIRMVLFDVRVDVFISLLSEYQKRCAMRLLVCGDVLGVDDTRGR